MAVFRIQKTENYTVMSNYHLRDRELSCKACGLLSKMLSLPDEWDYTTRGLAAICKDGVNAIGSALRELEERGYLVRTRTRDGNGRLCDVEYVIYERPQSVDTAGFSPHTGFPDVENPDMENPDQGKPYLENPDMEKPRLENHTQLNKELSSTKEESTNLSIYPGNKEDFPTEEEDLYCLYRERICENIEFDVLAERYGAERVSEAVELILEAILLGGKRVRIGGTDYPRGFVRNRMLKLDSTHMEYVFDCMDKHTEKICNIKAYLLKALFSAPATIDNFYRAEVNHDMHMAEERR